MPISRLTHTRARARSDIVVHVLLFSGRTRRAPIKLLFSFIATLSLVTAGELLLPLLIRQLISATFSATFSPASLRSARLLPVSAAAHRILPVSECVLGAAEFWTLCLPMTVFVGCVLYIRSIHHCHSIVFVRFATRCIGGRVCELGDFNFHYMHTICVLRHVLPCKMFAFARAPRHNMLKCVYTQCGWMLTPSAHTFRHICYRQ